MWVLRSTAHRSAMARGWMKGKIESKNGISSWSLSTRLRDDRNRWERFVEMKSERKRAAKKCFFF